MLTIHIIFGVLSLLLHGLLFNKTAREKLKGFRFATYGTVAGTIGSGLLLFSIGADMMHVVPALALYIVAHGSLVWVRRRALV
jgi:hypothetical protein